MNLEPELIPEPLWNVSAASLLGRKSKAWRDIRSAALAAADDTCSACGEVAPGGKYMVCDVVVLQRDRWRGHADCCPDPVPGVRPRPSLRTGRTTWAGSRGAQYARASQRHQRGRSARAPSEGWRSVGAPLTPSVDCARQRVATGAIPRACCP